MFVRKNGKETKKKSGIRCNYELRSRKDSLRPSFSVLILLFPYLFFISEELTLEQIPE